MPRRARTTTAPAILGKYFWLGGAGGVGEGLVANWAAPVSVGGGLAEAGGGGRRGARLGAWAGRAFASAVLGKRKTREARYIPSISLRNIDPPRFSPRGAGVGAVGTLSGGHCRGSGGEARRMAGAAPVRARGGSEAGVPRHPGAGRRPAFNSGAWCGRAVAGS